MCAILFVVTDLETHATPYTLVRKTKKMSGNFMILEVSGTFLLKYPVSPPQISLKVAFRGPERILKGNTSVTFTASK